MMELKHLRILVATIEGGSIQAASRQLNIAQPALSRRIRDLEAMLGCDLLVRGVRGVTPTKAGRALYGDALAILESVALAERRAQRLGLEQSREIRFGLVQTARKYAFVQEALSAFGTEHPEAGIALTRSLSRELAAAMRESQLDATLLYERHMASERFAERLIHKERYVLALHPSHHLATRGPASISDLAGEPLICVLRQDTANQDNPLLLQLRLHGLQPVVGQWAGSSEEMIDLVTVSCGMCITPASSMMTIPPGHLTYRPLPDFNLELDLSLGWTLISQTAAMPAFIRQLNVAIDRHQNMIRQKSADWVSLDGFQLFRIDQTVHKSA